MIRKKINKSQWREVHEIRCAYGLSCCMCEYNKLCKVNDITRENFYSKYAKNATKRDIELYDTIDD